MKEYKSKSRLRALIPNILLSVCILAICLVGAEAFFRATDRTFSSSPFYELDVDRGWRLRAGAEGWQEKEGAALVKINSHGFRDQERELKKSAGTYRIAVIGDSFTEALQVPLEQTYTSHLEEMLSSCEALDGKKVEVLNFGIKGYGTLQELFTLRYKAWGFDPDFVLLAFFTANDVYDNHPELNPTNADIAPYFWLNPETNAIEMLETDGLFTTPRCVRKPWVNLINRFRVVQFANTYLQKKSKRKNAEKKKKLEKLLGHDFQRTLIYKPPQHQSMKEAWAVTQMLIENFELEVEVQKRPLLLATLSNAVQVHPDIALRENFKLRSGISDLFYPDKRIEKFAADIEIPFIALAPEFRLWAEQHDRALHGFANYNPGFGHWNSRGHRLAAKLLSEKICSMMQLEAP